MGAPAGIIGVSWPWKTLPVWVENNDVIDQAVKDIIFTAVGERKMSVEFGSQALTVVFENKGVLLEGLAKRTISLAIAVNLPSVRVLNIDVQEGDKDTEPVTVTVDYLYLGVQGTVVAEIDGSN